MEEVKLVDEFYAGPIVSFSLIYENGERVDALSVSTIEEAIAKGRACGATGFVRTIERTFVDTFHFIDS